MTRKLIVGAGAIMILAALVWAGAEPWKTKPFQQWNDEDIQRVFTASPWARLVKVEATWKPLSADEVPGGTLPGQVAGNGGGGGSKGMGGTSTVLPAEHSDATTHSPDASYNVFWMSSETIRAALARRGILHSGKDEADAEKYVEAPIEEYQIAVQGIDMAPFFRSDERFFKENSFLQMKKTKLKISPSHVAYNRGSDGKTVTSVIFFFPKKNSEQQDVIAPDEKSVEFTCKMGKSTLHAVFEPKNMVNQKGVDL